jgi:pimeloyl-ACP methyl ester carboxylesterase
MLFQSDFKLYYCKMSHWVGVMTSVVAGLDGTGSSITPHLEPLAAHGLSVQSLHIPAANRLPWEGLTERTVSLVRAAAAAAAPSPLILVAESFGACLALRVMQAAPDAAAKLVLINSATSFNNAMLGVPGLVADTGLLKFFNQPLYNAAQVCAVLERVQATHVLVFVLKSCTLQREVTRVPASCRVRSTQSLALWLGNTNKNKSPFCVSQVA